MPEKFNQKFNLKKRNKILFLIAAIICLLSIILIPFGIIFIIIVIRAQINFQDNTLKYTMLTTKKIPLDQVKNITLAKLNYATYEVTRSSGVAGRVIPNIRPLILTTKDNKTHKLNIIAFENSPEINKIIEQKTKQKIQDAYRSK
ncbi:hypothetical protein HY495_02145 [Candidatus Woesearchaeota archaeon]|nr:hypothetical protein [Candidatus Woesearchaeota archaeon]